MNVIAFLFTAALAAMPMQQEAEEPLQLDLSAEVQEAALRVVAEAAGVELVWIQNRDPETGRFIAAPANEEEEEAGYFRMLYGNTYDPAVLMFVAASAAEMYSASDLRNQCLESTVVTCSDPFPSTVSTDALITAGVYAGVTALQRLAKTQWDVDLDSGWKNLLIFGGIAAVRSIVTASNISDANALRDLGR